MKEEMRKSSMTFKREMSGKKWMGEREKRRRGKHDRAIWPKGTGREKEREKERKRERERGVIYIAYEKREQKRVQQILFLRTPQVMTGI